MSTSLFRSKHFKSKKNLKHLTISGPLRAPCPLPSPSQPRRSFQHQRQNSQIENPIAAYFESQATPNNLVVVLVSKFKFQAETKYELSVSPKEYLMLLERCGNGWVKVQSLESKDRVGLVPASFLEISVNDPINPVSQEWLNEMVNDPEVNTVKEDAQLEVYPLNSKIIRVLQNTEKQLWYLVELKMSNCEIVYIGKRYHEFYNLHLNLMENHSTLPKLPPPLFFIPHSSKLKYDNKFMSDLRKIQSDLNIYFQELIHKHQEIQRSNKIHDFIFGGPFFQTSINTETTINDHTLISSFYPNSIDLEDLVSPARSTFSTTAPLPPTQDIHQRHESISKISDIDHNSKYSTYINQDTKKQLSHSSSAYTLQSYSSLIDGYDHDGDDDDDDLTESKHEEDSSSEHDDSFRTSSSSVATKDSSILSHTDDEKEVKPVVRVNNGSFSSIERQQSPSEFVFVPSARSSVMNMGNSNSNGNFMHCSTKSITNLDSFKISSPKENVSLRGFHSVPSTPQTVGRSFPERKRLTCSPNECNREKLGENDYIKLKFFLNNKEDDIVMLRIKRSNLISIVYLKKLLSYKIYKDYNLIDHYVLEPIQHQNGHQQEESRYKKTVMKDEELLEYIKGHSKVSFSLNKN
ncbi:uncharacterized protein J8A68_001280 [[Candida] subhashii]|uniref:SH3 domain-containing protein n=1 Tax=[Candida] subhashii TaxID=561895 RepID=A0A8J5V4N6_9ASCO|nr:uncharacterized protein J8A68_001280 [[Candida] subhashii]KAG7665224.1 hypothetical protein J8A68_001280 [[Candida] subhashii]